MTEQEKQEIINAVLAALRTNSKTIAQLTPVNELSDDDSFEVSGGRKVSYATLLYGYLKKATFDNAMASIINLMASLKGNEANLPGTELDKLYWRQSPIVLLSSMGEYYDGDNNYTPQVGDVYYSASLATGSYQLWEKTQSGRTGYAASAGVLYVNKRTGKMYIWTGSQTAWQMIVDPGGSFKVVNNLIDGGGEDALSAEMGKRLKAKINEVYGQLQSVYAKLAGIAFTDGKSPATLPDLDWGNPKHTVTLYLDLTNAVVKHNGETKNDGDTFLVEEGATLTLEVFADNNYQLNRVESQVGNVSGNVVTFVMGQNNVTLDILAVAVASHRVNINVNKINSLQEFNGSATWTPAMGVESDSNNESETEVSNTSPVIDGGSYNGYVSTGNGYGIFNVQVLMGSNDVTASAYNPTTKQISIAQVTDNISITVTVRSAINGVFNGTSLHGRRGSGGQWWNSANAGRLVKDDDWCVMTDLVEIPDDATHIKWVYGADVMPASDVSVSDSPSWRRTLIHYGDDLVPLNFYTISSSNIASGERSRSLAVTTNGTADFNGNSKKTKYVRASFSIANLSQSKLQYSKDGSTWIDLWVGSEHIINNNNE